MSRPWIKSLFRPRSNHTRRQGIVTVSKPNLVTLEDRTTPTIIDVTGVGAWGYADNNNVAVNHVDVDPTGTGTIDPFLRIHHTDSEHGYNTDYRASGNPSTDLLDDITDPNFTNAITLGEVREVSLDVTDDDIDNPELYREFRLDLGEPGNSGSESGLVNFSRLQFFLSSSPTEHINQGTAKSDEYVWDNTLGGASLVYNLDATEDFDFTLRDLTSGNGALDYTVYVKSSLFGADETKYLYLYSAFGNPAPTADGTFEEWAAERPDDDQDLFSTISLEGRKFYDLDADGTDDDGTDPGISGWGITISLDSNGNGTFELGEIHAITTDANGNYEYTEDVLTSILLNPGAIYTVDEVMPPIDPEEPIVEWIQTYGIGGYSGTLSFTNGLAASELDFGNVALGAGGGHTLGFWSNKNGKDTMNDGESMTDELAMLNGLNLVDASGGPAGGADGFTTYNEFRSWLLNATATNMAYMLSAQLAAMALNVEAGFVSGASLIYAPGTASANVAGFATVSAVMAEANASLLANPYTVDAGTARSSQESLKNALDNANNNLNFVLTWHDDNNNGVVDPGEIG